MQFHLSFDYIGTKVLFVCKPIPNQHTFECHDKMLDGLVETRLRNSLFFQLLQAFIVLNMD